MALIIPLQPVPNQELTTTLGNQQTQLNVYQGRYGLYMDVLLNNELLVGGVLCENLNRIIRNTYFGYSGDFSFLDTQGESDPTYAGFGDGARYQLFYLTESDLLLPGLLVG